MTAPRLRTLYDAHAARAGLVPDPGQIAAVARLEPLVSALARPPAGGLLAALRGQGSPRPASAYIWGPVGRGKSMLMDLVLEAVPAGGAARLHFHDFMQKVHGALHAARGAGAADPLDAAAAEVTAGLRFLALDEVEIIDIVDAMIVGRLFAAFERRGLALCLTSNSPPDGLYRDGLKRELFLPFVRLIERGFEVIELAGAEDYRGARGAAAEHVLTGADGPARIDAIWGALAGEEIAIDLPGRLTLPARRSAELGLAARAGFDALCDRPLGAATYLALADKVDTLLLDRLPRLGPKRRDAARRLMLLIDVLYDARIRLIAAAEAAPAALFPDDEEVIVFDRAVSRLAEMGAADWPGGAAPARLSR